MKDDDRGRGALEAENRAVSRTPMRDFAHLCNPDAIPMQSMSRAGVAGAERAGGAAEGMSWPERAMRPMVVTGRTLSGAWRFDELVGRSAPCAPWS